MPFIRVLVFKVIIIGGVYYLRFISWKNLETILLFITG